MTREQIDENRLKAIFDAWAKGMPVRSLVALSLSILAALATGVMTAHFRGKMTPNKLTIQTRRPNSDGRDPGAVKIGYWMYPARRFI
jgi:hypothetical protein